MHDTGSDDNIVRYALVSLDHQHDTGALVAAAYDSTPRHVWELLAEHLARRFGTDRDIEDRRALRHILLNPYLPGDIGVTLTRAAVAAATTANEAGGFGITSGLLSDITSVFVNPNTDPDAIVAIAASFPSIFAKHTLVGAHPNTPDEAYIAAMTHPNRSALGDLLNNKDLPDTVLEHLARHGDPVVADRVRQRLTERNRST